MNAVTRRRQPLGIALKNVAFAGKGLMRLERVRADGLDLPPINWVHADALGRAWIAITARCIPRTAFLGCVLGHAVASVRSPVAGAPPLQWDFRPD
ncbi:MAG: hypothetical protein ACKVQT_16905 [Burkholderiales bacterium]